MAQIMCTLRLKKALNGAGGPLRTSGADAVSGARLGNWAATTIRERQTDLVVALNERTYLTVVFPLRPLKAFRRTFCEALRVALVDHGVPQSLIPSECAQLATAQITRLRDAALREAIETAGNVAGVETDDHEDLREVQRNVNQFPFPGIDPCVPVHGVERLFGLPSTDPLEGFLRGRPDVRIGGAKEKGWRPRAVRTRKETAPSGRG